MDYFRSGIQPGSVLQSGDVQLYGCAPIRQQGDPNEAGLFITWKRRACWPNASLAARASLMAAKCERLLYYMNDAYKPPPCKNCIPVLPPESERHDCCLKEDYSADQVLPAGVEGVSVFQGFCLEVMALIF